MNEHLRASANLEEVRGAQTLGGAHALGHVIHQLLGLWPRNEHRRAH